MSRSNQDACARQGSTEPDFAPWYCRSALAVLVWLAAALALPECAGAQELSAEEIRSEVAAYVRSAMKAEMKLERVSPSVSPGINVSFTLLKEGAQLLDTSCVPRLRADFSKGVATLQRASGLSIEVRPPGSDATIVIVMGDTVGLKADPKEAPYRAWHEAAKERSAGKSEPLNFHASAPDAPITHARWGLYAISDRKIVHATSRIDWHTTEMSDSCELNFAREIAALYAQGLISLVADTLDFANFRQRLHDRFVRGQSSVDPKERTFPLSIDDLVQSNALCWEVSGLQAIDEAQAQDNVAACVGKVFPLFAR